MKHIAFSLLAGILFSGAAYADDQIYCEQRGKLALCEDAKNAYFSEKLEKSQLEELIRNEPRFTIGFGELAGYRYLPAKAFQTDRNGKIGPVGELYGEGNKTEYQNHVYTFFSPEITFRPASYRKVTVGATFMTSVNDPEDHLINDGVPQNYEEGEWGPRPADVKGTGQSFVRTWGDTMGDLLTASYKIFVDHDVIVIPNTQIIATIGAFMSEHSTEHYVGGYYKGVAKKNFRDIGARLVLRTAGYDGFSGNLNLEIGMEGSVALNVGIRFGLPYYSKKR